MKCIQFIQVESVNFKFNVWLSLTVVTAKFSARSGIIFKASLNFNCQIPPLQKLGGVGEAKYPKYQSSFPQNHRITVETLSN